MSNKFHTLYSLLIIAILSSTFSVSIPICPETTGFFKLINPTRKGIQGQYLLDYVHENGESLEHYVTLELKDTERDRIHVSTYGEHGNILERPDLSSYLNVVVLKEKTQQLAEHEYLVNIVDKKGFVYVNATFPLFRNDTFLSFVSDALDKSVVVYKDVNEHLKYGIVDFETPSQLVSYDLQKGSDEIKFGNLPILLYEKLRLIFVPTEGCTTKEHVHPGYYYAVSEDGRLSLITASTFKHFAIDNRPEGTTTWIGVESSPNKTIVHTSIWNTTTLIDKTSEFTNLELQQLYTKEYWSEASVIIGMAIVAVLTVAFFFVLNFIMTLRSKIRSTPKVEEKKTEETKSDSELNNIQVDQDHNDSPEREDKLSMIKLETADEVSRIRSLPAKLPKLELGNQELQEINLVPEVTITTAGDIG